jgi:hypothetical protein
MNRYNDYWTIITIHWAEAFFLLFKLNFSWPIQPSLGFTKPKSSAVLIKLLYPSTSLGSCALVHLHINPCTKLNKANYKIQDYFANRQIKEDVKCNRTHTKVCKSIVTGTTRVRKRGLRWTYTHVWKRRMVLLSLYIKWLIKINLKLTNKTNFLYLHRWPSDICSWSI